MRIARRACGVDEAGRGPLAGPVYAAAVILDPARRIRGLDDSKQLAPDVRRELAEQIRERALAWAVASASVEEIDAFNILRPPCSRCAGRWTALAVLPELALDRRTALSAAADAARGRSSTATRSSRRSRPPRSSPRPRATRKWSGCRARYPQYGFDRHKGYATPEHLVLLRRFGPCEVYRRSFAPVRALLSGGEQGALFPLEPQ